MRKTLSLTLLLFILSIVFSINALATDVVDSGYCGGEGEGTNLIWTLTADGTLTISGVGTMNDYDTNEAPWDSYRDWLKTLVLSEGITSIGRRAFWRCDGFSGNLIIPESVISIPVPQFCA